MPDGVERAPCTGGLGRLLRTSAGLVLKIGSGGQHEPRGSSIRIRGLGAVSAIPEATVGDGEPLFEEFLGYADEEWRRRTGRPMIVEELERVFWRYPGDVH